MIARIKQGLSCLFPKFEKEKDEVVKKFLTEEEYKIFSEMEVYDKAHSYRNFLRVKESELKNDEKFLKLALLHDCGKGKTTFFRRVKKVLIGEKLLEKHPEFSYEKLKDINIEIAKLAKIHHNSDVDKNMKIFQEIDDKG